MKKPVRRAVFLDRDGVIVEDVHYVRSIEAMRVLPGAAEAIHRLNKAGLKVVVVSNQSGVGRGYLSLRTLANMHRALRARLAARGAKLDAIYFCPHAPAKKGEAGCGCRKPATAMVERAVRRWGLSLADSFLVGDSTTDIQTARNAGCRAVLVRTGKGGRDGRYKAKPDAVCRDIGRAAAWILRESA
ncbi:MAG: D-glycero-beta-D-manno-heptose 1,7-bisphosphate 7-phosphatase [Elusimicrobia bacterium]|nr:D-glycero-beta-D-manno-heptose 1,7-bisphosphate 7-phosphatase [Elusimicrobiota bacterium]